MQEQHLTQSPGQCENCLPDAVIWATSTPDVGPKTYYVLIKDGDVQIPLEIRVDKLDKGGKAVHADIYTPQDYDYTMHDACDHENGDCIENYEWFQAQEAVDMGLSLAMKKGKDEHHTNAE